VSLLEPAGSDVTGEGTGVRGPPPWQTKLKKPTYLYLGIKFSVGFQ